MPWPNGSTAPRTPATLFDDGDAQHVYVASTAREFSVSDGTAAAPVTTPNPTVKVARVMNYSRASVEALGGVGSDGCEHSSAILGVNSAIGACEVQPVGVMGGAKTNSTSVLSNADACGVYGVGRVYGTGATGSGFGGFFIGRRETSTGGAVGIEVALGNYSTAATYVSATTNRTKAVAINALGTADSAVGIQMGNAFGYQFDVGIAFNGQNVGGKVGPSISASIRDDSASTTAIAINGTHSTAAVAVAAGSGKIIVGGTTQMVASSLLEVQGPDAFTDPLVQFGSTAFTRSYAMRIRNASGQALYYIAGEPSGVATGTVAGDSGIAIAATKTYHIGVAAATAAIKVNSTGIGFYGATPTARPGTYTPANVSTDRSFNANATSIDELADVLGTLIGDLQTLGLVA